MTADLSSTEDFSAADFAKLYKGLQEGEQTASEMEKKLDLMEKRMEQLLEQVEKMQQTDIVYDSPIKQDQTKRDC